MLELEFLPAWYPRRRIRNRRIAQTAVVGLSALVVATSLWKRHASGPVGDGLAVRPIANPHVQAPPSGSGGARCAQGPTTSAQGLAEAK